MKKVLLLLLFMSLVIITHAQENIHRVYCELLGTAKFMSLKVTVSVDFGQDERGWNAKLVDDNGKSISFNSMVDAMNYMGELGWKFEQAYVVTSSNQNVYHWLLSKDISKGEAINEGLKTKKDVINEEREVRSKDSKKKRSFLRSDEVADDMYN